MLGHVQPVLQHHASFQAWERLGRATIAFCCSRGQLSGIGAGQQLMQQHRLTQVLSIQAAEHHSKLEEALGSLSPGAVALLGPVSSAFHTESPLTHAAHDNDAKTGTGEQKKMMSCLLG